MNNPTTTLTHQPIYFIRETLSAYLQDHWTGPWATKWPITWQNMPPPNNGGTDLGAVSAPDLERHHDQRLLFQVLMARFNTLDLSASHYVAAGQIKITATAPKDSGMDEMDTMIDHVLGLFRGQHIGTISIGQITMDTPRFDRGYIVHGINLKFSTIINANT